MRLRPNVRAPTRFEDEEATFNSTPQKKKATVPAFPEKLAAQVVPFDESARPAAFPSLPLNEPKPTILSQSSDVLQNRHDCATNTSNSQSAVTALEQSNMDGFTQTTDWHENCGTSGIERRQSDEREIFVTWDYLELSVQYTIWLNFLRKYSHNDAVGLLRLSEEEARDIRVAVARRRQCPIDSSQMLTWLSAVEDIDGSLTAKLTSYLLFAASYELAFPQGVEQGRRFLQQLNLRDPSSYLGSWEPHPDGSGYLRSLLELSSKVQSHFTAIKNAAHPPHNGSSHAQQIAIRVSKGDIHVNLPSRTQSARNLDDAEYRRLMQANAERIRLLRISKSLECQTIPQKRRHNSASSGMISDPFPQPGPREDLIKLVRRPICIKNSVNSDSMAETALSKTPNTSLKKKFGQNKVPEEVSITSSNDDARGDHISGSMSLRNRDSLRDTQALTDLKENMNFWDENLIEDSSTGSEDDQGDEPETSGKRVVTMKIDDTNALASIFRGNERIRARPRASRVGKHDASMLSSDPLDAGILDRDTAVPTLAYISSDLPELFVNHFMHDKFPTDEKQLLLSKPIAERNTVEMWLIYGTKVWKTHCPWNTSIAALGYERPALGTKLDRRQASSKIGRCLVDEWNRYQSEGVGQGVLEETCIGSIIIETYHQRLRLEQQRAELVLDEKVLQDVAQADRGFAVHEIGERYHRELKTLEGKLRGELIKAYTRRFEELGMQPPRNLTLLSKWTEAGLANTALSRPSHGATILSTAETPSRISYSVPGSNFTRKLIETAGTTGRRPITPPEDDLGIFDSDDVEIASSSKQVRSHIALNTSFASTMLNGCQNLAGQLDDSPLKGYEKKNSTESNLRKESNILEIPLLSGDGLMSDAPPATGPIPDCGSLTTNIGTPRRSHQWSPTAPSYSPISEDDVFHSAYSSPTAQVQEGVKEEIKGVPDDTDAVLHGLIISNAIQANKVGTEEMLFVQEKTMEQEANNGSDEAPTDEAVMPSLETDYTAPNTNQVDTGRPGPRLKLTFNQSVKPALAERLPTVSNLPAKKSQGVFKPADEGEEATHLQIPISRVTRSMTGTPNPEIIITRVSKSKSKVTRKGTVNTTSPNKRIGTKAGPPPLHVQVQTLKQENGIDIPASLPQIETKFKMKATSKSSGRIGPRSTSKVASGSPTGGTIKAKSKRKTSMTPKTPTAGVQTRGKRGPYKKTREVLARMEVEQEQRQRETASADDEGEEKGREWKDAEMTG